MDPRQRLGPSNAREWQNRLFRCEFEHWLGTPVCMVVLTFRLSQCMKSETLPLGFRWKRERLFGLSNSLLITSFALQTTQLIISSDLQTTLDTVPVGLSHERSRELWHFSKLTSWTNISRVKNTYKKWLVFSCISRSTHETNYLKNATYRHSTLHVLCLYVAFF
jgi:hypothetical protein